MSPGHAGGPDRARLALAVIRLVNGTLALLVPRLLIVRLDPGRPPSSAAVYAFRMFGIRTVVLGWALLRAEGPARRDALDQAPLIHASDTAAATLLALRHPGGARRAAPLVGISAVNTLLAVLAARRRP